MTQNTNLSAVPELPPVEGSLVAQIRAMREANPAITQAEIVAALNPKSARASRPEAVLSLNVTEGADTLPRTGAGDTTGGIIALSHADALGATFTRSALVESMGKGVTDPTTGLVLPGTRRRAGSAGWWVRELIKSGHLTVVS